MSRTFTEFQLETHDNQKQIVGRTADGEQEVRLSDAFAIDDLGFESPPASALRDVLAQVEWGETDTDGGAVVTRSDAIAAIHGEEYGPASIETEREAAALVDFFVFRGLLSERDSGFVILQEEPTSSEATPEAWELFKWAIVTGLVVDELDAVLQRIETVREDIEDGGSEATEIQRQLNKKVATLEEQRRALEMKQSRFERAYKFNEEFPAEAEEMAANLRELMASIQSVGADEAEPAVDAEGPGGSGSDSDDSGEDPDE